MSEYKSKVGFYKEIIERVYNENLEQRYMELIDKYNNLIDKYMILLDEVEKLKGLK